MSCFKMTLFTIIFITGAASQAQVVEPRVDNTYNKQDVFLSEPHKAALKKYNHRFKVYKMKDYIPTVRGLFKNPKGIATRELPMAISGDFNADGKQDIVIMGQDGVNIIYVLLVSIKNEYKAIEVKKQPYQKSKKNKVEAGVKETEYGLDKYLSLFPKKKNQAFKKSKLTPRDFIQLEKFRGETIAYYFKDGKVIEYKGTAL